MLTESQITAGEHTNRSLEELFEFTDESSYFVAESTSQFIAEDSPCPPASLEEQVNDCTSFSGQDTPCRGAVGTIAKRVKVFFED
jgi:hypothetical protein